MNIYQNAVQERWRWSNQFIPEIINLVSPLLASIAPLDRDQNEATDLILLRFHNGRDVACRVRRYEYFEGFSQEFTLRCACPSGRESEITKIIDGFADWMFYGFANPEGNKIHYANLIDLDAVRARWIRCNTIVQDFHSRRIKQADGTEFKAFKFSDYCASIVIKEFDFTGKIY